MSPWRDLCFSKYERNKGWKHEICSWKYPRKLFHQFPWRTSASFSNLNSLRACQMSTVTVAQDLISADWLVSITQSCPTLCNPMNCSLPGSSGHTISQARTLEWLAISFSSGYSQPRDWTHISYIGKQNLDCCALCICNKIRLWCFHIFWLLYPVPVQIPLLSQSLS